MKKSFVLYSDFKATLDKLPDNEAGKLFKLILDFVNGIDVKPDSLLLDVVFEPIKQQMVRDQEKYAEELEKRRIAGQLGGLTKANNAKQNLANLASATSAKESLANLGDNVNENVSELVQVYDLFQECKGRTWMTVGNETQKNWFLNIEGKEFHIENDTVTINGSNYPFDKEKKNVGIEGETYSFRWSKKENNIF
jgi:hypothetical protein